MRTSLLPTPNLRDTERLSQGKDDPPRGAGTPGVCRGQTRGTGRSVPGHRCHSGDARRQLGGNSHTGGYKKARLASSLMSCHFNVQPFRTGRRLSTAEFTEGGCGTRPVHAGHQDPVSLGGWGSDSAYEDTGARSLLWTSIKISPKLTENG